MDASRDFFAAQPTLGVIVHYPLYSGMVLVAVALAIYWGVDRFRSGRDPRG
jgi:hypothetical protein